VPANTAGSHFIVTFVFCQPDEFDKNRSLRARLNLGAFASPCAIRLPRWLHALTPPDSGPRDGYDQTKQEAAAILVIRQRSFFCLSMMSSSLE
jgi:hypothetical protein